MGWRNEQCRKICRIIDNFLANRPTERDSLIVAVQKAFEALEQPETNCSEIPNSSDTISRQQAIDEIHEDAEWLASQGSDWQVERMERDKSILMSLPSAQPEIIRCKDCKYQTESWSGIKYCEAHGDHIGKDYDYCSNARRKENGH